MANTGDSNTRAASKTMEGFRLLDAGDYEEAIRACNEAIELDPSLRGPYQYRKDAYRYKAEHGAGLLASGDYEEAIRACTEVIASDPSILGAYRTRGEAYLRSGKEKEGESDLGHVDFQIYGKIGGHALCAHLRHIGVDARPAGVQRKWLRRQEVQEWLIDIGERPIRQVLITHFGNKGGPPGGAPRSWGGRIDYLVPDMRISPNSSKGGVYPVREKKGFLGPKVRVRWKKEMFVKTNRIFWPEVISRLTEDDSLSAVIREREQDLKIRVDPDRGCWVIMDVSWRDPMGNFAVAVAKRAPSCRQWDSYQAIARHLLAIQLTGDYIPTL